MAALMSKQEVLDKPYRKAIHYLSKTGFEYIRLHHCDHIGAEETGYSVGKQSLWLKIGNCFLIALCGLIVGLEQLL